MAAVLHPPLDAMPPAAALATARPQALTAAATPPAAAMPGATAPAPRPLDTRAIALRVLPPVLGVALLLALWALGTQRSAGAPGALPTPGQAWQAAVQLGSDPFHRAGPADIGIGWSLLESLGRLGLGVGLAALVSLPLGLALGRLPFARGMAQPLMALLKPVSPLAWLPVALLLFQRAEGAATGAVFICALWPLVASVSTGMRRVPPDYLNLARVLRLPPWRLLTRILLPAALPGVLGGLRRAVATAWWVVVAAEMLAGGTGMGARLWQAGAPPDAARLLVALLAIGAAGLLLDRLLAALARQANFTED